MASDPYGQYIVKASRQYGVPEKLIRAMMGQESGGNPTAVSGKRAVGLLQIHLPSHPDVTEAQAKNPAFNIDWSVRYFAGLKRQFGSWRLALAAYNAGPGAVKKYHGIPPYRETQDYVRKILAAAGALSPAQAQGVLQANPEPSPSSPADTEAPGVSVADIARQALARRASGGSYDPVQALTATTQAIVSARRSSSAAPEATPEPQPQGEAGVAPTPLKGKGAWYGSKGFADQLLEGIDLGRTGKRDRRNTSTGGVSDHWTGSKTAWAYDLSDGSSPTPGMDKAAKRILGRLGIEWDGRSPIEVTKQVGKYRVQVLYRTQLGGNHNDHIHVGVKYTG